MTPASSLGGGTESTFGLLDSMSDIAVDATSQLVRRTTFNGFSSFIDVAGRFSREQKVASQLTTCIIAGISLISSSIAIYWFAKMRKLFRHKLVMLLIAADVGRSVWAFIFTTAALSGMAVDSSTSFCQGTGYLTQTFIEASDYAILLIVVHTALQVFRPDPVNPDKSGLYRWRHFVFVFWAIIPVTTVALGFIQGPKAFFYNGLPICNLPVRPFWYRLAISWIPRYVILSVIIAINICIYVHAGYRAGMANFYRHETLDGDDDDLAQRNDIPLSPLSPFTPTAHPSTPGAPRNHSLEFLTSPFADPLHSPGHSTFRHDSLGHDRRPSDGTTLVGTRSTRASSTDNGFKPVWSSPRPFSRTSPPPSSISESQAPCSIAKDTNEGIVKSELQEQGTKRRPALLRNENRDSNNAPIGFSELRARRSNARKQMRTMFVYPIVYFSMWLIPFVNHLLQYDNRLVDRPIFALSFITWICVVGQGLVDSVVFSLREKPWRHIPGSDGTFLGSFCFWKHRAGSRRSSQAVSSRSQETDPDLRSGSMLDRVRRQARKLHPHVYREEDERERPNIEQLDSRIGARMGMQSWDFAQSEATKNRTSTHERYWFERQFSFALVEESEDASGTSSKEQIPQPEAT